MGIDPEHLLDFEAARGRPFVQRMHWAFIRTYKPALDDAPSCAFDSTENYRRWCNEHLESWLGRKRLGSASWNGSAMRSPCTEVECLFLGKTGAILQGYPDTTQDADLFIEKQPTTAERSPRRCANSDAGSATESAGKRRSTRLRHATPWLKTALVQVAWAATRKKQSYLQSQFRRLKGRRGPKKAIIAVAASMLTAVYFMLRDEKDYHDLGGRYLADRDKERVKQRLLRRLQDLGVVVEVKAA